MRRPPSTPQRFLLSFADGRVETIDAHAYVRIGNDHVFYTEKWTELLRAPVEEVEVVESGSAPE